LKFGKFPIDRKDNVLPEGQVECSVSDKPEGSEQAYNIMITTKTTLDNTSTAI
jgi:hypothetical protein